MVHTDEAGLTFYVRGYYLSEHYSGVPGGDKRQPVRIEVDVEVADLQAAREVAGMFPKYVRVKAGTVAKFERGSSRMTHVGYAWMSVKLIADETNAGRNEKGIERYRRFLDECDRQGWAVEYGTRPDRTALANMYATRAELNAALGI